MPSLPADTHIGSVHLAVADLEGAVAFYRDVLGFRSAQADGRAVRLSATGTPPYDLVLTEARRGAERRRTAGLYHFAVLLPSRADLGRALRHLIEAEAPIEGASDHLVSEAVYLHDPEGNGIEIYADRPRDRWPTRGGTLEMATKPLDMDGLFAEAGGPWTGMPEGTRIGHIHLRVADVGRAEQFYAGVLGFEVMVRGYPGALFVAAGGYHHHIGLNTWAGAVPPADPAGPGLRFFTVVLPDPASLEAAVRRAKHAGVTTEDVDVAVLAVEAEAGLPAGEAGGVLLRDPNGIGVVLTT